MLNFSTIGHLKTNQIGFGPRDLVKSASKGPHYGHLTIFFHFLYKRTMNLRFLFLPSQVTGSRILHSDVYALKQSKPNLIML